MRRFLVGLLATVGFLAILLVAGAGGFAYWARGWLERSTSLPDSIVLTLDLRDTLAEVQHTVALPLPGFPKRLTVSDVVMTLGEAAKDSRVGGLLAIVDDTDHGFAIAQELHQAVGRFRGTGRFATAWSDSFGELTSGLEGYYIASAFDEIALQPIGSLGTSGIAIETPFIRGLLDKLGIQPDVIRRAEYKTALESFSETEPTAANREMLEALLDGLWAQITGDIGKARKLDPATSRQLLGGGPYGAERARELGLVDRIGYRDEIEADVLRRAGADSELIELAEYQGATGDAEGGTGVALIRASGGIHRGAGEIGREIAADDLAELLQDATDDDEVRAILLRLDTPGGSAVASETIARQVRRAKARGKPVIVSMSNTAASGGYWISMDATRIVAQPTTLTGSIGVIAGKPVIAEASAKLGVSWASFARGEHAGLWSPTRAWDQSSVAPLEQLVDEVYAHFKDGVAQGRRLAPATVDAIARGRVYTGEQALALGLVDRLGGLDEAFAETRAALGLAADAPLQVMGLPRPRPPWRLLSRLLEGGIGVLALLNVIDPAGTVLARAAELRVR